jgi:hypothetical protein
MLLDNDGRMQARELTRWIWHNNHAHMNPASRSCAAVVQDPLSPHRPCSCTGSWSRGTVTPFTGVQLLALCQYRANHRSWPFDADIHVGVFDVLSVPDDARMVHRPSRPLPWHKPATWLLQMRFRPNLALVASDNRGGIALADDAVPPLIFERPLRFLRKDRDPCDCRWCPDESAVRSGGTASAPSVYPVWL